LGNPLNKKNQETKSESKPAPVQLDSGGSFYKLLIYGVIGVFAIFVIYFNVAAWTMPKEEEGVEPDDDTVAVEVVDEKDIKDPEVLMKVLFGMRERVKAIRQQPNISQDDVKALQNQRIEAAEKLLEIATTDEHTAFAAKTCFESYLMLDSLGDEDARGQLKEFVERFKEAEMGDVAFAGQAAILSLDFGKVMDNKTSDFQPVLNQVETMMQDNLEDPQFAIVLRTMLERLLTEKRKSDSDALMRLMLSYYKRSPSEGAKDITDFLEGMIAMEDANIGVLAEGVVRGTDGSLEKFKSTVKSLVDKKAVNLFVFSEIVNISKSLAQAKYFEKSRELDSFLLDVFANYENEEVANFAKTEFSASLKRLDLIGKKIEVRGRTLDGEVFDQEMIKDRVIAVYFCSVENPGSLQFIGNLVNLRETFYQQGFELVGYVIGEDPQETVSAFNGQFPPFPIVVPEQSDESQKNYADSLGVISAPYIILANKEKIIQDVEVLPQTLAREIQMVIETGKIPSRDESEANQKKKEQESTPKLDSDKSSANKSSSDNDSPSLGDEIPCSLAEPNGEFIAIHGASQDDSQQDDWKQEEKSDEDENPYLAPSHWSTKDLVQFILEMKEKPRSIMKREQFALAIADAADRVLASDGLTTPHQRIAILGKTEILHQHACDGNDALDQALSKYIEKLQIPNDKRIQREIAFLKLEQQVIQQLAQDEPEIEPTLKDLTEFFTANNGNLNRRHLRLASTSIELVNRMYSDDEEADKELLKKREEYFKAFGEFFVSSKDKRLSKYGKYLTKSTGNASAVVGKPLELSGTTVEGEEFDWASYRGKVVVVDFWATWCGPCRAELPNVKALYEELNAKGLEIVGISLDDDLDAVAEYSEAENIPWKNIVGEKAKELAQQYGVKAIPTMMVVDQKGNVVAVNSRIERLKADIQKTLDKN